MSEPVLLLTLYTGTYYWKWKRNYREIRVGREDMTVNQGAIQVLRIAFFLGI